MSQNTLLSALADKYALDEAEQAALAAYVQNRFADAEEITQPDTDFLSVWRKISLSAVFGGTANAINQNVCPSHPVNFRSPELVRLEIYPSIAGEIPIIYAEDTADFEALVTNIVHKGEPQDYIAKTGASFISGKTVRFIILSAKPYSNVPAEELGLDPEDWKQRSIVLRRSHECTHFFTKQTYGISNNILHDELMADFIGLYDAFGFYKAEWFLRFMGLIPGSGARLAVYTKELSPKVTEAVQEILEAAAYHLEAWSQTEEFAALDQAARIRKMCRAGIAAIAENAAFA